MTTGRMPIEKLSTSKHHVKIDLFEGPLDLLLYLIKKQEIEIEHISLEQITRQYQHYLNAMQSLDINVASEFIVMASHLLFLKSQCLLPNTNQAKPSTELEHPKWELIRQLVEYKKFKEVALHLSEKERQQARWLPHTPAQVTSPSDPETPDIKLNLQDLVHAFQQCLKRLENQPQDLSIDEDTVSVVEKLENILNLLTDRSPLTLEQLTEHVITKLELITIFLALLEGMKQKLLVVEQAITHGSITVSASNSEHSSFF